MLNEADVLQKDFCILPYEKREHPFPVTEQNFVTDKKISKDLLEILIPTPRKSRQKGSVPVLIPKFVKNVKVKKGELIPE